MSKETGGPAFPTADANYDPKYSGAGLSTRDYFAAESLKVVAAMMQVSIAPNAKLNKPFDFTPATISELAYAIADGMIAERAKQ